MKNLIFSSILFFSFSSFSATDYLCRAQKYEVELELTEDVNTNILVIDTTNYWIVTQGFVGSIEKVGDQSVYHFSLPGINKLNLTFRTKDAKEFPKKMYGYMHLNHSPLYFSDTITCFKN